MKVNPSYQRMCHELILNRFLALPDLQFAAVKRELDETGGVYGLESLGGQDPRDYLLTEEFPCEFRVMSTFLITTWPFPDEVLMEEIAQGHMMKSFALTVGTRSKWVFVFNLDQLKKKRKDNPDKAISVPAILEIYYHFRPSPHHPIKGDWTKRGERSKLVYVPETENWYFTYQLSALAAFGVMDDPVYDGSDLPRQRTISQ
jgi:hypothetical protein